MILKNVDAHGRLIIPIDLLRTAGINRDEPVELYGYQTAKGEPAILIKPYGRKCSLCGQPYGDKTRQIRDKKICKTCWSELKHEIKTEDKEGQDASLHLK